MSRVLLLGPRPGLGDSPVVDLLYSCRKAGKGTFLNLLRSMTSFSLELLFFV